MSTGLYYRTVHVFHGCGLYELPHGIWRSTFAHLLVRKLYAIQGKICPGKGEVIKLKNGNIGVYDSSCALVGFDFP